MTTFELLPTEILLKIFLHIDSDFLYSSANLVCQRWNQILNSYQDKIAHRMILDLGEIQDVSDKIQRITSYFSSINKMFTSIEEYQFLDVTDNSQWELIWKYMSGKRPKRLFFIRCRELLILKSSTSSHELIEDLLFESLIHLSIKESKISTKFWESVIINCTNLQSLVCDSIPPAFIPIICENNPYITSLEVGPINNSLLDLICQRLQNITELTFKGNWITYSGLTGLVRIKQVLKKLRIIDPENLTKYSIGLILNCYKIENLKLEWSGPKSNIPWSSYNYLHNQVEQRIEKLFEKGSLVNLTHLSLSGFFRTTDDKLIQLLSFYHLSSKSEVVKHLKSLDLRHCYLVSDNGVQWLTGSFFSPGLSYLDLSGTDLTGNCFIRKMPALDTLKLEACLSLTSKGLVNIALTCPNLTHLSFYKCKQINSDYNLSIISKNLKFLKYLDLSHTATTLYGLFIGSIQALRLNCCSHIRDLNLSNLGTSEENKLKELELGGTNVTGEFLKNIAFSRIKRLFLDFCLKLKAEYIEAWVQQLAVNLKFISLYGSSTVIKCRYKMRIIQTPDNELERNMREYMKKRDLHISNWVLARNKLFAN